MVPIGSYQGNIKQHHTSDPQGSPASIAAHSQGSETVPIGGYQGSPSIEANVGRPSDLRVVFEPAGSKKQLTWSMLSGCNSK